MWLLPHWLLHSASCNNSGNWGPDACKRDPSHTLSFLEWQGGLSHLGFLPSHKEACKHQNRRPSIVFLPSTRIKRRHPEGWEAGALKPDTWVLILVLSHTRYVSLGQCIPFLCLPQFPALGEWAWQWHPPKLLEVTRATLRKALGQVLGRHTPRAEVWCSWCCDSHYRIAGQMGRP